MGVGGNPLCISYDQINYVASIPPMNGIDPPIYMERICQHRPDHNDGEGKAHQKDIERLILQHPRLERIRCQTSILCNLNDMALLL